MSQFKAPVNPTVINSDAYAEQYAKVLSAMTGEELHSKADIAHEITMRDLNINSLSHHKTTDAATALVLICHSAAQEAGWWDNPSARDVPRLLMLCVSELSEAMEGDRKDLMDEHLPDRKMIEVELADCLIRIFDMAGGLGLDVGGAMQDKIAYNATRADHKKENREGKGGKKY